jgi:mRNA interferase RelE/StbE
VKRVEWAAPALQDLAALDKALVRRVKAAIERFALTGTGDVKKLQGIDPPEFCLRIGDWRVRFDLAGDILRILRVRNRKDAYR